MFSSNILYGHVSLLMLLEIERSLLLSKVRLAMRPVLVLGELRAKSTQCRNGQVHEGPGHFCSSSCPCSPKSRYRRKCTANARKTSSKTLESTFDTMRELISNLTYEQKILA